MHVYVDSSALLKRAIDEPESDAVEAELERLDTAGDTLVSSSLAWIEVSRALRSRAEAETPELLTSLAETALSGIVEQPIGAEVVSLARRIGPPALRSLDAIHLASATIADADLVVAFDERLLTAAEGLGFRVLSPGAAR